MKVKLLSPEAKVPTRATPGSAGVDLYAVRSVLVPGSSVRKGKARGGRALIPTGVALIIPNGCVGRICSRSGLSVRHNIEVGAGWIDSDYRGEIHVELKNFGGDDFHVKPGMRIAQLILLKIDQIKIQVVKSLPSSKRSCSGFSSTGLH